MNGLNESNVTCVTCATNVTNVTNVTCAKNVTCVTNVTNEFDETRFLSFVQSDSAASKAHFILSKRRRRRSNRVQRILPRVLRETNNPREPQSQRILLSSSSFRARSGSIFPNLMRLLLYFHQFTNLRFSTFLLSGR